MGIGCDAFHFVGRLLQAGVWASRKLCGGGTQRSIEINWDKDEENLEGYSIVYKWSFSEGIYPSVEAKITANHSMLVIEPVGGDKRVVQFSPRYEAISDMAVGILVDSLLEMEEAARDGEN